MDREELSLNAEKIPFWKDLTSEEKQYALKNSFVQKYGRGGVLYASDGMCLGLIHVLKGTVRAYIVSEDGREITLYRIGEGDTCVLSAWCVISQITFETEMAAETDSEILVIRAGAFKKLTETNIYVKAFTYELATERFSSVMWVMQQMIFQRFDRRLADFLVSRCEQTGSREIKMTQEEIARDVNSAREVVARMLKQFSSDGLIKVGRGKVTVLDPERLEKTYR